MNASLLVAYLVTVTVLMLTPGPDMLFCFASGLRGGSRAGALAAVGAASGEVVHISASALGLAALFRAAPFAYDALRIAGALYLVALGIRTLRARDRPVAEAAHSAHPFRRGLVTNLLNPKMALFTIAFLPQFVDRGANVPLQFVVLGACFVGLELLVDGTVGALAGRLARVLRSRRATRTINTAAGAIYVGLGARVAAG